MVQLKPLPLDDLLRSAGRSAERCCTLFRLWMETAGSIGRADHHDAIADHWECLRFLEYGQLFSCVVESHSLLDGHKDAITIPRLIKLARLHGADTGVAESYLAEAAPITAKLAILRHKAFAHRSASMEYDDVFRLAQISSDEIGEGCAFALRAVNQLLAARGRPLAQRSDLPEERYSRMLRMLQNSTGA